MADHPQVRWALVVLSFGSGATDAFAFLALGGVFTANMTGNLVLAGLVGRPEYLDTLLTATLAVVAFVAAMYVGFRWTRTASPRPLLAAVGVVQAVVLALWIAVDGSAGLALTCTMITLSAIAMGWHTVLGRRMSSRAGLTTTFVTGTLTSVMQDLAEGRREAQPLRLVSIAALVLGSFAGALVLLGLPRIGPVLPVVAAIAAWLLLRRAGAPRAEE
ncbi:YoaK family protein [Nakamurella deserti]|uniref:YoaK family protein n=1 Tax=Nakamurella deserti TaxID=2164074 RepID=UPI000DBE7108|nr:YoaK family protein [Nakamurella deserti]